MTTEVAQTPSGEHSEAPYLVASAEEELETRKLKAALEEFYAAHDKRKLKQGLDDIIDWTRRNGVDALNVKLNQKYGEDLSTPREVADDEEVSSGPYIIYIYT